MSRSLYLWTPFTHCTYPAPRNHFYVNRYFYKQKFHLDYQFETFLSLKNLFWYPEIIAHVKSHVTGKFKHREQRNMKNSFSATCYPEKQQPGTISSVMLGAGTKYTHTHTLSGSVSAPSDQGNTFTEAEELSRKLRAGRIFRDWLIQPLPFTTKELLCLSDLPKVTLQNRNHSWTYIKDFWQFIISI